MAWTKEQRANHCRQIGTLGGQKTAQTYGSRFMSEIGKIGFEALCTRHELSRAQGAKLIRLMNDPDRNVRNPMPARFAALVAQVRAELEGS